MRKGQIKPHIRLAPSRWRTNGNIWHARLLEANSLGKTPVEAYNRLMHFIGDK